MTHELVQFFTYAHLPERLQTISQPFADLAGSINDAADEVFHPGNGTDLGPAARLVGLMKFVDGLPENCERRECMRKLRGLQSLMCGYGTNAGGLSKGMALRVLLEAKDCAVRSLIYKLPA